MSRKTAFIETFKKGRDFIDDLSDEIGDYLETGEDFFKKLGGETDTVTRNALVNKFNRQVDISDATQKRGPKGSKQRVARDELFNEINKRRSKQLITYMDEDPVFEDALIQADKLISNVRMGQGLKYIEGYDDFLKNFSQIYQNKNLDKKSFDKFNVIYQNLFNKGGRPQQLRTMEKAMLDRNLITESDIMSAQDSIKILQDKGINMRGFIQGSENPAHMYDFIRKELADLSEKYRTSFVKKYGEEPLGRNFTRQSFYDYVKKESPLLKNYFNQVGFRASGKYTDTSGDLKELKRLFEDAKIEYPDQIGEFNPGSISTLRSKRSSDYVADYEPGGVRWSDGTIIKKGSDLDNTIRNFKRQIMEFVPVGDNMLMVGTNLDNNINRMINKQVLQGVDPLKAANNVGRVLKNTDPKKMSALSNLLNQKQKISDRIKLAREKGLTNNIIDDVSLAHVTDVADDYRLGLEIDNLFLAPLKANTKQYTFYDKELKKLQGKLQSGVSDPAMSADITRQIDDLGKQLEAEGIVTDVGYGRVGKARSADDVTKMYDEQLDFYMAQPEDRLYTADMNERIKQGAQGPGFNEGGSVDEEPVVDEETGMMDYLTDARDQLGEKVNEGLRDYFPGFRQLQDNVVKPLEEFRDKKSEEFGIETKEDSYKIMPRLFGEMLELPGEAADFFVNMDEKNNHKLELRATEAEQAGDIVGAERLRKAKTGVIGTYSNPLVLGGKFFDFWTKPLQEGYANMFEDTDYIYNPFTEEKFYADNDIKKVLFAAGTIGLTGLEVFLALNPLKMKSIAKLPNSKLKPFLQFAGDTVKNVSVPLLSYEFKDPLISPVIFPVLKNLFTQTEEVREKINNTVPDDVAANVGVEGLNPENFEDGGMVGDDLPLEFLENANYAQTRLSRGGEPGQFTNPTSLALEEDFDARDILNEPGYESIEELDDLFDITKKENRFIARDDLSFEVASRKEGLKYILGNVPEWVRQGKDRIQKLLPKSGDELEQSLITRVDDTAEGLTPISRQQPGQIFYQQMEAELMQGPKVFKDKQAFFDYMQARNIGKVEVLDSEIERVIDSLTQKNLPITRETLIGVLRESPVRFVQSKGYGFLSDTLDGKQRGLKYSGYKESGEIPNTSRERVLFVDPKDLRGDPGGLPSSMGTPHNWEEPYTIAWSRLSDRDLGGAFTGKTVTFADEIQSDIFQGSQKMATKLAAKIKYMADNNVPLEKIDDDIQREILAYFGDRKHVFRESLPSAAALKNEYDALMSLQDQLRELANTPVPEMTDAMIEAAKKVQFQQADIIDGMVEKLNLDLNRYLFPNLPFKLRGQWADASIKRDIYEAAYRKFVLKDPNATDYYAVTPANLVTNRYSHSGSTATPAAERAADKQQRIQAWVNSGMEGNIGESRYPGVGFYEFYGGPGPDVVTEAGKHYTGEIEKILKRIARENGVPLQVLPVRISDLSGEVFNVVDRNTGEILGTGVSGRQADAIANDIIANSDRKVVVRRGEQFDTADSFGIELTPSMAEAFKAYMAKGGYVNEEILLPYGD